MADLTKVRVFCSYAHEDETFRSELSRHLSLLEESGTIGGIEFWWDGLIAPGQNWNAVIDTKLRNADVIVFLVSVDFLSSQFVREVELPRALAKHQEGSAVLIAVLLRWVLWEQSPLRELQALPDGLKPVESWPSRDMAYTNICEGILKAMIVRSPQERQSFVASPLLTDSVDFVMESGLPREVTVGKRVILVVLVRSSDETSLAELLETEPNYNDLAPEDVKTSRLFEIDFPRGPTGRLMPRELGIRLETADFRVENKEKFIEVYPSSGNEPCIFILEPLHQGELLLNVELLKDGRRAVGSLLRSTGVTSTSSRFEIASVKISSARETTGYFAGFDSPPVYGERDWKGVRIEPYSPAPPQSVGAPPSASSKAQPATAPQRSEPFRPKGRKTSWLGYAATLSLAIVGVLGFLLVKPNRPADNRPTDNLPANPPAVKEIQATFQPFDLPSDMRLEDLLSCITPTNGQKLTVVQLNAGVEGVCYLNALEGDGPIQVTLSMAGPSGPVVAAAHQFANRTGFRFRTKSADVTWLPGGYALSIDVRALQSGRIARWSSTFTIS